MTFRDLLHDPMVYENPGEFQPRRWLTANQEKLRLMNEYFRPFGYGSRMCLGFQ